MINEPGSHHQQFGRYVLRQRADSLIDELISLTDKPTEKGIHDTRVQSRRLRAALEAFEDHFPPRPWKALYASVKEITRRLGGPRELGVTVELMQNLSGTGDMAENMCREYLLEKYAAKLDRQERRLRQELRSINPRRLRSRVEFLLCGMEPDASWVAATASVCKPSRRRRSPKQQPQPTLFPMHESDLERARRVLGRLAFPIVAFRAHRGFHRTAEVRLHALRISTKKLRYAMEIFDPLWPGGLQSGIAECRFLQDAAGEYHDWCILRDYLRADIRRLNKGSTVHIAFQIGRLLAFVEDRRAELKMRILPALTTLQASLQGQPRGSRGAAGEVAFLLSFTATDSH